MRAPVLDVEPQIDQQKQPDQARPVAERDRDRRQSDLVDRGCNDAEDQTASCRLGDEVADRHADRDARIFHGYAPCRRLMSSPSSTVVTRKIGKKINMTGLTVLPSSWSKLR